MAVVTGGYVSKSFQLGEAMSEADVVVSLGSNGKIFLCDDPSGGANGIPIGVLQEAGSADDFRAVALFGPTVVVTSGDSGGILPGHLLQVTTNGRVIDDASTAIDPGYVCGIALNSHTIDAAGEKFEMMMIGVSYIPTTTDAAYQSSRTTS